MTLTTTTKERATTPFLSANLIQTRLVSEHLNSPLPQATSEPKQVQLRAETSSSFAAALDNPQTPTRVLIEVEYIVTLKLAESDVLVADYKAKHAAEFKIVSWGGFEDWTQLPQPTLSPYFAMSNNFALRRAQRSLLDMGLGAVVLPVITEFASPAALDDAKA